MEGDAVAGGEVEEGEDGEDVELCGGGAEVEREGHAVRGAQAGEGAREGGREEEPVDGLVADLRDAPVPVSNSLERGWRCMQEIGREDSSS